MHLRAQIARFELKEDLSPIMLKEIFHESLKNLKFTRIFMEYHSSVNHHFWDIQLEIYMLPNFNMLFQLVLTKIFKSELFSCLSKVDHVTN